MSQAIRGSSVGRASVSVLCGLLLLTAVGADEAMARVSGTPRAPSGAPAQGANGRAQAGSGRTLAGSAHADRVRRLASARSASCSRRGPNTSFGVTVYCPNYVAGLYVGTATGTIRVDTLRSRYSWFVCQVRAGPNPAFGVGRNHWWLLTMGDDYGRWGWFPANAITIGGQEQPIPGVRVCSD